MLNTILESVEEIIAGIELEVADVPVSDLPDYLPRMCGCGTGNNSYC